MKKLLAAALAAAFVALGGALFAAPAVAQGELPQFSVNQQFPNGAAKPFRVTKHGGRISQLDGATNDVVTWDFLSDHVSVCLTHSTIFPNGPAPVYIRFGTSVPTGATTISVFATGDANVPGQAMVLAAASPDATTSSTPSGEMQPVCLAGPWRTRGIVLATAAARQATVNVIVVGD